MKRIFTSICFLIFSHFNSHAQSSEALDLLNRLSSEHEQVIYFSEYQIAGGMNLIEHVLWPNKSSGFVTTFFHRTAYDPADSVRTLRFNGGQVFPFMEKYFIEMQTEKLPTADFEGADGRIYSVQDNLHPCMLKCRLFHNGQVINLLQHCEDVQQYVLDMPNLSYPIAIKTHLLELLRRLVIQFGQK